MPFATIEGREIHYHEQGGPTGPPLLCIHGAGGNHTVWLDAMKHIAGDRRAIALDLPGHGLSSGPASESIADYVGQAKAFVDALDLAPLVICGHSMGGGVAVEYGLLHPENLAGLVLVSSGARLRVAPAILELLETAAREGKIFGFEQWAFAPGTPQNIIDRHLQQISTTDPWVRLGDMRACDRFDRLAHVGDLHLPALILAGTLDQMTPPKYSEYLAGKIQEAELVLVEEAGHMLMLERPETLGSAVSTFLEKL